MGVFFFGIDHLLKRVLFASFFVLGVEVREFGVN